MTISPSNQALFEIFGHFPVDLEEAHKVVGHCQCINDLNAHGDSILSHCIISRYRNEPGWDELPQLCAWLIDHGADVNLLSDEGTPPLWDACLIAHPEAVHTLLTYGADPGLGLSDCRETLLESVSFDIWYHETELERGESRQDDHDIQMLRDLKNILAQLKRIIEYGPDRQSS